MKSPALFLIFCFISLVSAQNPNDGYHSIDEPGPGQMQIQLLYFANINGNLENCGCGDPPLGGMDNLAYWIDVYRRKDIKTVVVAGGDIFNTYPDKALNSAVMDALKEIQPDVYAPGEQELLDGSAFFLNGIKKSKLCLIETNYALKKAPPRARSAYRIKKPAIQILSYFSNTVYFGKKPRDGYETRMKRFKGHYQKIDKKAYTILLFHGPLKDFRDFISGYPGFDLALISHDQRLRVQKNGNMTRVLPGADGEYLIRIVLYGPPDDLKPWFQKIPIRVTDRADPAIRKRIEAYHKK